MRRLRLSPCLHAPKHPLVPCSDAVEDEGEQAGGSAAAPALRSFWGVASVLTATVKAKTAEVLTAVKETDWRAELEAFQQVSAGRVRRWVLRRAGVQGCTCAGAAARVLHPTATAVRHQAGCYMP